MRLTLASAAVLISVIFCLWATGAVPSNHLRPRKARLNKIGAASTNDEMAGEQSANIPYFTLRDGMNSTLTLQNRAPSETVARVTLFSMDGRSQGLAPIAIAPYSFIELDLRGVVEDGEFKSGNIQVAFTGLPMILAAQISITSSQHPLSYESRAQVAMDFMSTKLNGILWLPRPGAEGSLAITNVATTSVAVHLESGGKQETLTLASHNTRVVKFDEELNRPSSTPVLVKLQHDGLPGDIITTGFVLDSGTGYSSGFTMFDSSIMNSSELGGVHFRFGVADPREGFPEGTSFRAPLLLANVGSQRARAQVSVDYTTSTNQVDHVSLKKLDIAPGDVQRIELTEDLALLGITGPVQEAGLEITYDAPPGTLIAQLTSFDQTADFSFEVPIKDPHASNEQMEGIYPWTIRNGVRSVLHLKNTTADPATALLIFELPGGKFYQPSRIALQPFQSLAVDIGMLKNANVPDALKRRFPGDATNGLAQWRQEIPYSMIGRLEQIDLNGRISHSFSCGQLCCSNFTESAYVTPDSVTGPVGASFTLAARVRGTDCNAVAFDNTASFASLSSQNTNVATVDSSGNVTLKGPGTTTITAQISVQFYFEFSILPSNPPQCDLGSRMQSVTVSITVQVPTSLKVLSVNVLPTGTTGDYGCKPGFDYGIAVDVKYQVLDQQTPTAKPIATASMTPHEHIVWSDGTVSDTNVGPTRISTTSGTTAPDGTFHDAPFLLCSALPSVTRSNTQTLTIILNGQTYKVRTQKVTFSATTLPGHGTAKNDLGDINASR